MTVLLARQLESAAKPSDAAPLMPGGDRLLLGETLLLWASFVDGGARRADEEARLTEAVRALDAISDISGPIAMQRIRAHLTLAADFTADGHPEFVKQQVAAVEAPLEGRWDKDPDWAFMAAWMWTFKARLAIAANDRLECDVAFRMAEERSDRSPKAHRDPMRKQLAAERGACNKIVSAKDGSAP